MKITFLLPYAANNGGTRVVFTYAQKLQELGHSVTIISQPFMPFHGKNLAWLRAVAATGLGRRSWPHPPPAFPVPDEIAKCHSVLPRPGAPEASDVPDGDVIIATWWETAYWVAALPALKGRKFHLLQGYEIFDHLPLDRVRPSFNLGLHQIAVSNFIREQVVTHHGPRSIDVIPNAVDLAQFNAPPRSHNDALTVGFVYTKTPVKNIGLAIAALQAARKTCPALRAFSFGTHAPSDTLPLPDWIEFHKNPPPARIPELYAKADLWLWTSTSEGFGLPILEAMACRTPVIATRAGAAPDIVDGENGLLIQSDCAEATAAIEKFYKMDNASWVQASRAAAQTAAGHSWDKATERLLGVLQSTAH